MEEMQIPVNLYYWTLALLPIALLLFLLVGLRWRASEAAPVSMLVAFVIALLAFQAPWETLAVAGGKGVWDAINVLLVIWTALLLYRVGERAGAFTAIRAGFERISTNELFLVLVFGWVFASAIQGVMGFGVPIAVVAPLLLGFGVRPLYAVAIPLIGHAWANMYGTLAVGWIATLQVVDLQNVTEAALQSAILLWIPTIAAGFTIAWFYGGLAAVRHALPFILIISSIHGILQFAIMPLSATLSAFLAAAVALGAVYPLSLWRRYAEHPAELGASPVMRERSAEEPEREEREEEPRPVTERPVMPLGIAALPYGVLLVTTTLALLTPPIETVLAQVAIGLPFPGVDTGFGVTVASEAPYSELTPLTHPGAYLLLASLVGGLVYRAKGYYQTATGGAQEGQSIILGVIAAATPASIAVISLLVMSKILDHTGQVTVLALGIAEVSPPLVFAFLSTFIGILGAFMTSSSTASNILFAPLQTQVAAAGGITEASIIGAQNSGGAIGNAIAPANVALGTGAVGAPGTEGDVLRVTLPWSIAVGALTGIGVILLQGLQIL